MKKDARFIITYPDGKQEIIETHNDIIFKGKGLLFECLFLGRGFSLSLSVGEDPSPTDPYGDYPDVRYPIRSEPLLNDYESPFPDIFYDFKNKILIKKGIVFESPVYVGEVGIKIVSGKRSQLLNRVSFGSKRYFPAKSTLYSEFEISFEP